MPPCTSTIECAWSAKSVPASRKPHPPADWYIEVSGMARRASFAHHSHQLDMDAVYHCEKSMRWRLESMDSSTCGFTSAKVSYCVFQAWFNASTLWYFFRMVF